MSFVAFRVILIASFTPGFSYGINDEFGPIISGSSLSRYEFYIFNRWGELVFESYNPIKGWDGTYMNKHVQIDAYVWFIRTWDHNEKPHEYIGHVTVVK